MLGDFDPILHIRQVRAHPTNYLTIASIVADAKALAAIKRAQTLEATNKAYQTPAKAAKAAGDAQLLNMLTDAAKVRKSELTKV